MRTLILAAGRGTRISRYLAGNPKCTVDIGGICLIQYTVNMLKEKGITDIGMVLGYGHEAIERLLEDENVRFYYNPFFDVTNSIASVWFVRDFLDCDDDVMIMNGDVFLESALVDDILVSKKSPLLFSDESRKEEADYKFYYENSILMKYGKELTGVDITGEYVGVGKLAGEFMPVFLKQLDKMIEAQKHFVWWENVLYELIDRTDIYVQDVAGKFWAEVDYIEDYERILKFREYKLDFNVNVHKY